MTLTLPRGKGIEASSKAPDNIHVDLPSFMFPVLYDTARPTGREHLTVGRVVGRLKRDAERAPACQTEKPAREAQQPARAASVEQ